MSVTCTGMPGHRADPMTQLGTHVVIGTGEQGNIIDCQHGVAGSHSQEGATNFNSYRLEQEI